jgi:hypothetical protein
VFKNQTKRYLYRRQYLLAPRRVDAFSAWNQFRISNNYYLSAHPDLTITEAHCQKRSIYLLGFIIDPYNPSFHDSQIIQDVIDKSKTADDVFENIADKCGRFVIIAKIEDDFRIFSDTCGMRQVFYHVDRHNRVWCSSQPHIIADQLGLKVNEGIQSDLKKTVLFKTTDHWYPGRVTLFDNIYHLTPNHYLDFNSRTVIRYWPNNALSPISMSECIPKVQELLSGIIEGAVRRFNLAFAISSGLDSRVLLAASRKSAKSIHYFTHIHKNIDASDPNVAIPSRLLKQLELKHTNLMSPEKLCEDFKTIFEKNIFTARPVKGLNALAIYNHFRNEEKEIVVMFGNCSEITKRDRYRFPKTPKSLLSGTALAVMAQMGQSYIAREEFSKWLNSVKKLTRYNLNILDLMHWEQRVGNWAAMTFSEYEMFFESFCPFSCRKYIEYMLRVPFKYRTSPDYKLHHEIMRTLWPEVLKYEINPVENRMKKMVEDFLYRTNIYDPIKFLYLMLYKRFQ